MLEAWACSGSRNLTQVLYHCRVLRLYKPSAHIGSTIARYSGLARRTYCSSKFTLLSTALIRQASNQEHLGTHV